MSPPATARPVGTTKGVTRLITQGKVNWAARVAIAKYKPLIRAEGMPNRRPTRAALSPPRMTHNRKGTW